MRIISKLPNMVVPSKIILDKRISHLACRLYGLYYMCSQDADSDSNPDKMNYFTQGELANYLNCSVKTISIKTHELRKYGWLELQRRGRLPSIIRLKDKPKRRGAKDERGQKKSRSKNAVSETGSR